MPKPRTMRDIGTMKTARSALPRRQDTIHLQLHRLVSEKIRLEQELEQWSTRKGRLEEQIGAINGQIAFLQQSVASLEAKQTETQATTDQRSDATSDEDMHSVIMEY